MAHFGLSGQTQVDRLEIRWPSGQVDVLTDIPADQKIRIFEGRVGFHAIEPTRWEEVPDSLVAGTAASLTLAVRPALFEPGAKIVRVAADLSELGGPQEVLLTERGDGTYGTESIAVDVAASNGLRQVAVSIEQETSLGLYWTRLSRSLAVSAAFDDVASIYSLRPLCQR